MVWEIPYTFIAGTKAKANEVNGNFTSIKQFVDQLESNLATAELDISNLEANKADINGNQNEIFQVANAENNKDAVNLETLKDQTANSLDAIRGFIPSKSNATTISCTAGDCWDSTYKAMISSSKTITLQDTNLAKSSTYYIYVCYDKETSGCKLAFSTNSNTPTLPVGYDYFRKVGSFTTNSSGDIEYATPVNSAGITLLYAYNSGYTFFRVWSDGWIEQGGRVQVQVSGNDSGMNTITFPRAFTTKNYIASFTPERYSSTDPSHTDDCTVMIQTVNLNNIKVLCYDTGKNWYKTYVRWYACGK